MIVCEGFNEFQVLVHWRKIYFIPKYDKQSAALIVYLLNLQVSWCQNYKNSTDSLLYFTILILRTRLEQNIQFCLVRMRKKMQSSPVTVDVNQLLVYLEHWLTWNSNLCKSQAEGCWNSYDLARQNLFLWHVKIRYRAKNWNLN